MSSDIVTLNTLRIREKGWASVILVGDIGGLSNTGNVTFTGSFLTSITRTSTSTTSIINLSWTDKGYDIVPIFTFANFAGTGTDANNNLINDIYGPVVITGSLSRTGCRIFLEEMNPAS